MVVVFIFFLFTKDFLIQLITRNKINVSLSLIIDQFDNLEADAGNDYISGGKGFFPKYLSSFVGIFLEDL